MMIIGVSERSCSRLRPREQWDIADAATLAQLPPRGAETVEGPGDPALEGVVMPLPVPRLFAASTTLTMAGTSLSVMKRRIPMPDLGSQELVLEAMRRAKRATIDEARWLASVRHPGVVQLRRVVPEDHCLETRYAGRTTLRSTPLSPSQAAHVLRDVAMIVSELHAQGLVHGRLGLDHVIITQPPPAAVLCSPNGTIAEPADDVKDMISLAEDVHRSLDACSRAWSETVSELRAQGSAIRARDVVDAFENLGRSGVRARPWFSVRR